MGRPINKKYFGNTNDGVTNTTSDDHIGGEGIASINWSNLGLFRGNDATNSPLVGLALPAPTIPTGVQATWTVTFEVASVSTGAGKAGLVVGDTYTYAAGGSPTITVATISGANATFTTTGGSGVVYGSLPKDTTGVNITKVTGSGPNTFLTDINFKVKSATINEKGSGYTGEETFTVTTYSATTGAAPAGTIQLDNNQQNAIVPVDVDLGSVVDIFKQESATSFWVIRWDGPVASEPYLLDLAPPTANVGMYVRATDSTGRTYWVKKISGHRVTLGVVTSGGEFGEDDTTTWTFDAPVAGVSVKIRNA
jgi:hypothetical protein